MNSKISLRYIFDLRIHSNRKDSEINKILVFKANLHDKIREYCIYAKFCKSTKYQCEFRKINLVVKSNKDFCNTHLQLKRCCNL